MSENARRRLGAQNTIELYQPPPPDAPGGIRHYPDAVKARYFVAETKNRTTFYRDYKGQEAAFRLDHDRGRMTTRTNDIATLRDMMAVAGAEGWKAVRLGGSKDFRRETWIEATARDIETTGYKPTALDRQEAERRRARRGRAEGQDLDNRPAGDRPPQGPATPPDTPRGTRVNREADTALPVPDSNVLSLEIEKATRSTRAVQRDEARIARHEARLGEDQASGRPGDMARDAATRQRDATRIGADRAHLSDAAQAILATLGGRIDKELTALTGGEKERLKDFTAGILAAREFQVGRLQHPGSPPRDVGGNQPAGVSRAERQPARDAYPEPQIPLPRRQRDFDRSL